MATLINMASSPNCKQQVDVFVRQNKKIMDIYKKHMEIREKGNGDYLPVIRDMVDYMSHAFHEENMIMMQNSYPGFLEHAKAHQKFTEKIEEFLVGYEKKDAELAFKIFIFLKEWMRDHTSKLDVECAIYIRNNPYDVSSRESENTNDEESLLAYAVGR